MSRKATITQKEIVNAAFKITRKEGFEQITSRKLAAAAGCSTQPIFRIYENMDALKKDVYDKAAEYYLDYYDEFNKTHDVPFVDLGLAYIGFAQKYPHLFRLLFISEQGPESKSMYDLVNGNSENVVKEINKGDYYHIECPSCGKPLHSTDIYCSGCGQKLAKKVKKRQGQS
ncbi:MAG: TetR/AcrR family transcriptional regulator [Butyrivibrio sp.]|nr:TetR/AcrR family transcriptional regulator [Butyrivibrio sp.]